MTAAAENTVPQLEDALDYLPRRNTVEYRRGQVIYDAKDHPSNGFSLIISGRVKVARIMKDGAQAVTGIFSSNAFFGQGALLGTQCEQATALEQTALMSWTRSEIEALVERQPKLGLALIQILVERCQDLQERLQSLALDSAPERVALSLIRFAKSGTREGDGKVLIPPMTHELLSGYIGTSREIVTSEMNRLRRQGFLQYSRKAIELYPEALTKHLRSSKTT